MNDFIFSEFKSSFCKHFFSRRATGKSKIVNTKPVYFPYKIKLRPLANIFFTNQKSRNAIFEAENLLIRDSPHV